MTQFHLPKVEKLICLPEEGLNETEDVQPKGAGIVCWWVKLLLFV